MTIEDLEKDPEAFIWELYDAGWRQRFDLPYGTWSVPASLIAKHLVGWCDASRLAVRPRTNEFAFMCEIDGERFWFHHLPVMFESIAKELAHD